MLSYILNDEEIGLIQEYRRITTGQQQAIIAAVHQLSSVSRILDVVLPKNVVALVPRA